MAQSLPAAVHCSLEIPRAHQIMSGTNPSAVSLGATMCKVIECFGEARVDWCLVGAHAVGMYTEPRATLGFDFVVDDRRWNRLPRTLKATFGELGEVDMGAAVRLSTISVDLIRASSDALFQDVLRLTTQIGGWNVPRLEVLLVLKFLAATSTWRGRDPRGQDVLDLARLYRTVDSDQLDGDLMRELAGKVYPGAETEFAALPGRLERGEPLSI